MRRQDWRRSEDGESDGSWLEWSLFATSFSIFFSPLEGAGRGRVCVNFAANLIDDVDAPAP